VCLLVTSNLFFLDPHHHGLKLSQAKSGDDKWWKMSKREAGSLGIGAGIGLLVGAAASLGGVLIFHAVKDRKDNKKIKA
jgi:hypothetical protein